MLFKLHHANLPKVHDYFVGLEDEQYLVMEYIEGEDPARPSEKDRGGAAGAGAGLARAGLRRPHLPALAPATGGPP